MNYFQFIQVRPEDQGVAGRRLTSLQKRTRRRGEQSPICPENHDVTAQKNYWNRQINRRQLSWTQLFNDLQRIMPARAFVSSVHPEITLDNRLKLTLVIKGDTHENGLELVKKMEKSERFRSAQISSETMKKRQKTGTQLFKFDIVTYYSPAAPAQGRDQQQGGLLNGSIWQNTAEAFTTILAMLGAIDLLLIIYLLAARIQSCRKSGTGSKFARAGNRRLPGK